MDCPCPFNSYWINTMKLLTKTMPVLAALLSAMALQSSLSAAPLPAPLDSLGPNFLTLTGGVSAAYNSNVLSSPGGPSKFDDFVFTFNPGITLDYGKKDELGDATLTYSETFLRYDQHSALNEELSNLGLNYVRQQSRFTFTVAASYDQSYQNSPSSVGGGGAPLTAIIRDDIINGSGDVHWNFSDKFNFDASVDFSQNNYLYQEGQGFNNSDTYTVPLSAYYVYSDALSFGVGYTYQETDAKGSTASPGSVNESNSVSLNVQLAEWEKLTGSANVGLTDHSFRQAGTSTTSDTGSYGLNLAYAYSEKVGFNLAGSRGFNTGTQGQNIESTNGSLGVNYAYTDSISLQATLLGYTYSEYLGSTRNDNTYTTGVTVNWQAYTWLTLSAGYTYFMNSSSAPNATYNINVVTISAMVKY